MALLFIHLAVLGNYPCPPARGRQLGHDIELTAHVELTGEQAQVVSKFSKASTLE